MYDVTATDPDNDKITFKLAPESIVDDMSIDADTGKLTWTPDANGIYEIAVRVVDSFGAGTQQIYRVLVDDTGLNEPPRISTDPPLIAEVAVAYSYDIDATDPENGTLTYSIVAPDPLLSNMSIDAVSGLLQWTPAANSTNQRVDLTIRATDPVGLYAGQNRKR
jgi:hypothetical protein